MWVESLWLDLEVAYIFVCVRLVCVCVCTHAHALYCLNYAGEMLVWCFFGGFTENDQVKYIWELDLEIEHYTEFFIPFNQPCQVFSLNFFYITGQLLKDVLTLRNLLQLLLRSGSFAFLNKKAQ